MGELLQQVVNGLSSGSIYVLVAIGITLVFGVSRLVNFAHGQFLVLGSFLMWTLVGSGVPFVVALVPVVLAIGLVGVATDRLLLRRTLDAPVNGLIVSFGLVLVIEGVMLEVWSSRPRKVANNLIGVLDVGFARIPFDRILTFGIAGVGVLALYWILRCTDAGRCMRAAADDRETAALLGINVGRSITVAFFIGACLAGLAGAFVATLFPFTAYTGTGFVIKGLAVAIIAGLGSVSGALIVGLTLGVTEALGSAYLIGPEWQSGYAYLAMALLLLWRPQGLFGGNREY